MRLESLPGSVVDQKYRIDRVLGKGAMGAVFQATHLGTTRTVALKVIVPNLAEHAEFSQRFKREAEAAGRLRHINVVNVTDFGVTRAADGELAYLVMEYLDGETLSSYLRKDPRPPFNLILDVIEQTARALDAAHAAGIVHRDLKPSNIWLEPNHRGSFNVKVLDFGIAKVGGSVDAVRFAAAAIDEETVMMTQATFQTAPSRDPVSTPSSLHTTVGTLLGTPSYMAPEQCRTLSVDGRADIYSLAVIAYEMLCSRLPFQAGDLAQLIQMQIQAKPESPHERDASVPIALADIVINGLDKDPERRPPTAGAFAARMRTVAEGELGVLRKSKDVAHTHINCFFPVLLSCIAFVIACVIPLRLLAHAAFAAKAAPVAVIVPVMYLIYLALNLFALQLYKAACMLMLDQAAETGQFRPMLKPVVRSLVRGLPALVRTHLRSALDPRPSAFRDNLLWPVVWAKENLSGQPAIVRSRELCRGAKGAAIGLMIRQCAPSLIGVLAMPASLVAFAGSKRSLQFLAEEILSLSPQGWFFLLYPLFFMVMFLNFAAAFSFLYWSALRGRGEGPEIFLPVASRGSSRNSVSGLRPGTLVWAGIPLALAALILVRITSGDRNADLEVALEEGRATAALRHLNAGIPVDQRSFGRETPLFEAARRGQRKLVQALLDRGASVNARDRWGSTPLVIAAAHAQNEVARLLLDRGAAVDLANDEGRTPLMTAAMSGNKPLVQLLLERGANAGLADTHHKTALAYAREEGNDEIAGLLQSR